MPDNYTENMFKNICMLYGKYFKKIKYSEIYEKLYCTK